MTNVNIVFKPIKYVEMKIQIENLRFKALSIRHYFYVLLVAGFFNSCDNYKARYAPQSTLANEMQCPVILFAKIEKTEEIKGAIVLRGADGELKEMMGNYAFAASIANTYNIGDTIIACH